MHSTPHMGGGPYIVGVTLWGVPCGTHRVRGHVLCAGDPVGDGEGLKGACPIEAHQVARLHRPKRLISDTRA
eukprot:7062472-Pyramimonas_sp.AAC.1